MTWRNVVSWQDLQQSSEYEFTFEGLRGELAGFVVHYEGNVYAYHNCCPHQQVFLNWSPHQFYDRKKRYVMCSTHGALFEPQNGLCVDGPCFNQSLQALDVRVSEGQVQVFVD